MMRFLCFIGFSTLLPILSFAQALSYESGLEQAPEGATCISSVMKLGDGDYYKACTSFIRTTSIVDFINKQSARSGDIEARVTSVRQDLKQISDLQSLEISNLKNSFSNAELQNLIQKMVREELSKRGL